MTVSEEGHPGDFIENTVNQNYWTNYQTEGVSRISGTSVFSRGHDFSTSMDFL